MRRGSYLTRMGTPGIVCLALLGASPALAQISDDADPADETAPDGGTRAPSPEYDGDAPWNQGVTREAQDAARAFMLEGNRLIKVPLFVKAAARYEEAIALWDHPAFRYNLAVAQLNLVQPIEAYKNFELALRYGEAPLGRDKYERARSYLETLGERLTRLKVTCEIAGAEVSLDGQPLFTGPGSRETLVTPGRHQIVAKKEEYVTDAKEVELDPGHEASFLMIPIPVSDVTKRERYWAAWKPWILVGAGAGILAGAGYLDWNAAQAIDRFDEEFAAGDCAIDGCARDEIPDMVERLEAARTRQDIALGLYIVGGSSLVAGAILVYINRERLVDRADFGARGVSFTPVFVPGGTGLSATFRY